MEKQCNLTINENSKLEFLDSDNEQYSQVEYPHKWNQSVITYAVIVGSKDAGIFSKLRRAVGLAFSTWGAEIPIKFKRVSKNNNPDVTIKFVNDENEDKIFLKNKNALAYAGYPKTKKQGLIVFNDYAFEWGTRDLYKRGKHIYNVVHVLIHEIGHTLGLSHASIVNGPDIMDPFYHNQISLSDYDKVRIKDKYGVRIYRKWASYNRLVSTLFRRKKEL